MLLPVLAVSICAFSTSADDVRVISTSIRSGAPISVELQRPVLQATRIDLPPSATVAVAGDGTVSCGGVAPVLDEGRVRPGQGCLIELPPLERCAVIVVDQQSTCLANAEPESRWLFVAGDR